VFKLLIVLSAKMSMVIPAVVNTHACLRITQLHNLFISNCFV